MMFDLTTVWILIILFMIFYTFWQFRKFAETANRLSVEYCKRHKLQLLSVAMQTWHISFKNGIKLQLIYDLNYSANGINAKKGEVILVNGKLDQIHHWG